MSLLHLLQQVVSWTNGKIRPLVNFDMNFKELLKVNKLLPLSTVLGSILALVLSLLGVWNFNIESNIIIALLALISVDALSERITVIWKLEEYIKNNPISSNTLRPRSLIKTPIEQAKDASEICILSLHGSSIIPPYINFYSDKLKKGCKIRIILVSPYGSINDFVNLIAKNNTFKVKESIEATLSSLCELSKSKNKYTGTCDVRLSDTYYPFSIFAVDINKPNGLITAEFHSYKSSIHERPHITLSQVNDTFGYFYFKEQFEDIWNDLESWDFNQK